MVLFETPPFTRHVYEYLTDEEYHRFQVWLAANPDAGDIIPQSGGIRKVRWGAKGKGKRGGLRIIYYWWARDQSIYLLTIYEKGEMGDLSRNELRSLKSLVEGEKR